MSCDAIHPRLAHLPLLALLLLLLRTRLTSAQSAPQPAPSLEELKQHPPNSTTLFGLPSSYAPSLPSLREPVRALLAEVSALERALAHALRDELATTPTCNQRDTNPWRWRNALTYYFGHRRWGGLDLNCISDALSSSASVRGKRDAMRLFQRVAEFSSALESGAATFVARSRQALPQDWDALWTDATRLSLPRDPLSNQLCVRDYAFFVKRGNVWYVSASVTNVNPLLTVQQGNRSYIGAYLDRRLRTLPMMLPTVESAKWKEWREGGWRQANAFVRMEGGAVGGTELLPTSARENAAVQLSIPIGAHAVERANDALTISNSAILMLPLVFNVIPVALIADVNTLGMLVYTLLTDVLTAVPLLVKGVEVVVIGGQNTWAAVTRVTGANLELDGDDNKAAEMFVARCWPERSFRSVGVALIVVAIAFMVGGVLAEFAAMRWRQRRMKSMVLQTADDKQNATHLWVTNGDVSGKSE